MTMKAMIFILSIVVLTASATASRAWFRSVGGSSTAAIPYLTDPSGTTLVDPSGYPLAPP